MVRVEVVRRVSDVLLVFVVRASVGRWYVSDARVTRHVRFFQMINGFPTKTQTDA